MYKEDELIFVLYITAPTCKLNTRLEAHEAFNPIWLSWLKYSESVGSGANYF